MLGVCQHVRVKAAPTPFFGFRWPVAFAGACSTRLRIGPGGAHNTRLMGSCCEAARFLRKVWRTLRAGAVVEHMAGGKALTLCRLTAPRQAPGPRGVATASVSLAKLSIRDWAVVRQSVGVDVRLRRAMCKSWPPALASLSTLTLPPCRCAYFLGLEPVMGSLPVHGPWCVHA